MESLGSGDWQYKAMEPETIEPEIELVCRQVQIYAAKTASRLADTWYGRPTHDEREAALEVHALMSAVKLEAHREQLFGASSPKAVSVPPSVRAVVALPLDEVNRRLPFSEDERVALRAATQNWDFNAIDWKAPISEAEQELVNRWHGFLRKTEPGSTNTLVNEEALVLWGASRLLYYGITGLIGRPTEWPGR